MVTQSTALQAKIESAVKVLADAIEEHNPVKVYALVSGGNDSTVVADLAYRYGPKVDAIVHINTGIGVPQTREFVREFSKNWLELPLIEKHAPKTYEELVLEYGFPGPAAHRYMYSWLKERSLREVRREAQTGRRDRVMFITGVRHAESSRRMGHVQPVQRDGNTVWVAPILDFEHKDMWDYREQEDMPTNEVVAILHMSGECLCGAFSKPGEFEWIKMWYPDVATRIENLQMVAKQQGVVSDTWGPQSSRKIKHARERAAGMLCSDCVQVN